MKYLVLIVTALALVFTVPMPAKAQLALATPSIILPHATGPVTTNQVAAMVAASGATIPSGAIVTGIYANARTVTIIGTLGGERISITINGSSALLQAIATAGAALPTGKTLSQVSAVNVFIPASGNPTETAQFSS